MRTYVEVLTLRMWRWWRCGGSPVCVSARRRRSPLARWSSRDFRAHPHV